MRKIAIAAAVGASMGVAMMALAADPLNMQPEARAYVNLSFGESAHQAPAFFYGLRMDYHRNASAEALPPMAQVQFDRHGFSSATFNGLPFARSVRLNQDEGGGESGESAESAEPVESVESVESADAGSTGEGESQTQYTVVDWGMVVLGVAGVGFAVSEISSNEESPDSAGTSTGGGGTTGGGTTGGTLGCLPGTPLCTPFVMRPAGMSQEQYDEWRDGGTGQMGDLIAR